MVRVLGLLLDRNRRQAQVAKVRKMLFIEKRKERLHGGMQWDLESGGPLGQVGNRVLYFFYSPRAEIFPTKIKGEVWCE